MGQHKMIRLTDNIDTLFSVLGVLEMGQVILSLILLSDSYMLSTF
jgi:hypothetical protein